MVDPDEQVNQKASGPTAEAPGRAEEAPGAADPRRALPSVDRLVRAVAAAHPELPAWAATEAARHTLDAARAALAGGGPTEPSTTEALARPRPGRVVNATGVVLHTNLGRAVLAPGAAVAAAEAARSYGDLELDAATGRRGDRLGSIATLLARLSGAEAAHAVNNNAAATLLAIDTLARGREVVVSRGELVEIGGSFRVPEILERAGVRLVEVGTTNRTHLDDYRRAIGPDTALLLKVHRSNFEISGFTAEVGLAELSALGREAGVPVLEDLGSGALLPAAEVARLGLPPEACVAARVAAGADCVCFSGDKLLGGPQAGLLVGRRAVVEAMRRNPLARALRLEKLGIAALDWTLRALAEGRADEIPTLRQLAEPAVRLRARAEALAERLAKRAPETSGLAVAVVADRAAVGGGSLPGLELDTWAVVLRAPCGPDRLAAALRAAPVPVLARVRDDAVWIDARTLLEGDEIAVERALERAIAGGVV